MKLAFAALVASLAIVGGLVDDACACSCVPPNADAYLERYDGAFIGRLVEKRDPKRGMTWSSADPAVYVFEVESVLKGELPRELHVISAVEGASCGLEVPRGTRTGLFLDRDGSRWRSSLCLQVGAAALEQAAAGAGLSPRAPLPAKKETGGEVAGGTTAGDDGRGAGPFLIAGGIGAVLLAALAGLLVRRRRGASKPAAA